MNSIFTEFENENSMRTYPFASGCTVEDTSGVKIPSNTFIDAAIYPVNSKGELYLSSIDSDGTVSVSDSTGVVMTAVQSPGSKVLEFYDTSDFRRHVGTIIALSSDALSSVTSTDTRREFMKSSTKFASTCIFPIVNDGVMSVDVGGTGKIDGIFNFSNENNEQIRVSSTGNSLRFDVIPEPPVISLKSIQHVYCIVDGRTPFRIIKLPYYSTGGGNTVAVYLDNLERGDICSNAHREASLEMVDTCEDCESSSCHHDPINPKDIPYVYQTEVVDIPNGADSAFYLAVPNFTGYDNPLSITMTDGATIPKSTVTVDKEGNNEDIAKDDITTKGIILQVPGLTPIA